MSDDGMEPMATPASLITSLASRTPIVPPDGTTPRRRGRPPGSKNKPKDGALINPSATLRTPGGRTPGPTTPVDQAKADAAAKEEMARKASEWINKELNDQLFMLLMGFGVPANELYKEGRIPPKAAPNPDLTEFGNAIAIPPDVCDSWGKLYAELSYTGAGKNLTKNLEGKSLGVVFAGLSAVYSTFRYAQTLKPILAFIKAQAEAANAQTTEDGDGTA